jgi:hypothetical protein
LGFCIFCAQAGEEAHAFAPGPDTVILKDGRKRIGTIVSQNETLVVLRVADDEMLPIAMSRVARIEKGRAADAGAQKRISLDTDSIGEIEATALREEKKSRVELWEQLKNLGSPSYEDREAAMKKVEMIGARAAPLLTATLNPQGKSDLWLRVGAIRALVLLAPLDNAAAQVLAFTAMHDPAWEVRREACRAIRILREDRATEYLLLRALREDVKIRGLAALALREIDDPRTMAKLVSAVPTPSVHADVSGPENLTDVPSINLPVGPGGMKVPVFLPEGEVRGSVTNISAPSIESLKLLSGKDMGNLPRVWINWLNEKVGTITSSERDQIYQDRSLLNRSNSPAK